VPQLNANSSSIELLDVDQFEFVRGPQSALFGRNTLGGVVNVTSARPARDGWTGSFSVPFGNHGSWTARGGASGPLGDTLSAGVSFAQVTREGFTVNDITGNDIDDRSAFSSKAQVAWTPNQQWEARVIFTSERARDGDYALNDVGRLRVDPFRAARDFEGYADRDVIGTTVQTRRSGQRLVFSTTTGFVNWKTQDVTDLDYTPAPLLRRDNTEEDFQFTQEVRLASADASPIRLGARARLGWQGGVFFFTQNYEQDAINSYAPFVLPGVPIAVDQHTPVAELEDVGVGVFGQGTVTLGERLDLTAGARVDHEDKRARLASFFRQLSAPMTFVEADENFSNVSPQASVAYRVRADKTVYATVGRGYKAGGFNSASPLGSEAYGEERAWHLEGGVKSLWADGRFSANAAVFYIDWTDLQLNVPNPDVAAQFFITNLGGAISKGVELELSARAAPGLDLFATGGYTQARFADGSSSGGVDVAGNTLPSTPEYTMSAGAQYSRRAGPATVLGRADTVFYGSFKYDDQNTLGQDAYSLVNLRLAVSGRFVFGEVFVRNAFDTRYIPLAFAYGAFAPSGFLGEMGAPRTFGASAGVRF
jgi:iron complex outermembrane recepter protein